MKTNTLITIGLTESDHANNYSSFSDGYRKGADQQKVMMTVPAFLTKGKSLAEVAEAVFVAVNSPEPMEVGTLEFVIQNKWDGTREALWLRSVSVGDTVTFGMDVDHDPTVACDKVGWVGLTRGVRA